MLRSIEGSVGTVQAGDVHESVEQLAKIAEAFDEGVALRHALIESAIAGVASNDKKRELRALARVLQRQGDEIRARLDLVLNQVSRLA